MRHKDGEKFLMLTYLISHFLAKSVSEMQRCCKMCTSPDSVVQLSKQKVGTKMHAVAKRMYKIAFDERKSLFRNAYGCIKMPILGEICRYLFVRIFFPEATFAN